VARRGAAEIWRILPAIFVGIGLGATVLVSLPRAPALAALGVFVAGYGAWQLAGARRMTRASAWWALPIGLAGGAFSVMFGTGGRSTWSTCRHGCATRRGCGRPRRCSSPSACGRASRSSSRPACCSMRHCSCWPR